MSSPASMLDEMLSRYRQMPEADRKLLAEQAVKATAGELWIPNPGPQTEAYFSKADILLYGGEPGGGKTQLILGLAFNQHHRSLIMRRQYTDLNHIVEEAIKLNGGRKGFKGSPPPQLKRDNTLTDFGAALRIGDEQHWQGQPHDFIGLDEATQFAYKQVRFLLGWMRHENPKQRKRMVLATNPPLSAEGLWVVQMFAPWLDERHPNPARPGELRWFVTDEDGKDMEVDGPGPVTIKGKSVDPLSRTYIPASLKDNPFLIKTGYQAQLDGMIEPYRSILLGGFRQQFRDAENQIIPTEWVRQAQQRWTPHPPPGVPMCAIGVDVAAGGDDETVLAIRHDGWFAPFVVVPGKQTPYGRDVAGLVVSHRRDQCPVVIDMGGGYGGAALEVLRDNQIEAISYKGAEGSVQRTSDKQIKFVNRRTQALWRFREALDPSQPNGSPIALPDDPALLADLTAPTFEITPQGIKAESKEDVCERLGRSTDRGDAVIMAWTAGPTYVTDGKEWARQMNMHRPLGRTPEVVMGRKHARRRR